MGNGMYTLVDKEYSKLFTYDSYGNLLYAFGGEGEALGLFGQLASVACDGDRLLALDLSLIHISIPVGAFKIHQIQTG